MPGLSVKPSDEEFSASDLRWDRGAVTVLIVHPNRLFREALAVAINHQRTALAVMGCVANVEQARRLCRRLSMEPDILLVERRMARWNWKGQALRPRSPVTVDEVLDNENQVVVPADDTRVKRDRLRRVAVLINTGSLQTLLNRVSVLARRRLVGQLPSIPVRPKDHLPIPASAPVFRPHDPVLTTREQEILQLRREGLSNKEMAIALQIGVQTVKNHVHSISMKIRLSRGHP